MWPLRWAMLVLFVATTHISAGAASARDAIGMEWLIQVADAADARTLAASLGADYLGALENVSGYHRIRFIPQSVSREANPREAVIRRLRAHSQIVAFEEDIVWDLQPRRFNPPDPLFRDQWHLENTGQLGGLPGADARVRPAWDSGLSGHGIILAVVDTGTDYQHPDLLPNWLQDSGYDFIRNNSNPFPSGVSDRHGTAVAGIIASASNSIGGLGIAFRAQFVPLRLISERDSDEGASSSRIAEALAHRRSEVDIYNNSWGPAEGGYSYTSSAIASAFAQSVANGRGGLGNIYVWAAGNGGLGSDNSNYDFYNSQPYTISVGAVGDNDTRAGYSEQGANLLVVAPSGDRGAGITTTDNRGSSGYNSSGDFYDGFNGTSAAAPMVAGVISLMLEANPLLNWREVQQILAYTAVPVDFSAAKWQRNGAGHWVSHDYGFGRVDAAAATDLARQWRPIGPQLQTGFRNQVVSQALPPGAIRQSSLAIPQDYQIEFVRVRIALNMSSWENLHIELISPEGSRSTLARPFQAPSDRTSPGNWIYLSLRHLDEFSAGQWILRIENRSPTQSGTWTDWGLDIWGRPADPRERPLVLESLAIDTTQFPVDIAVFDGIDAVDTSGLRIVSVQQPRFGSLESIGPQQFRYTMGLTETGADSFSFLLSDNAGRVARRLVEIRDPRPIARPDLFTVASNQTHQLPVLDNDLDPNGDPLRIVAANSRIGASVAIAADSLHYSPPLGFSGIDRISYSITDDADGLAATVATVVVQDRVDAAMQFDGMDDFILLPPSTGSLLRDRFTAEAWIYARTYGEYVTGFGRIFDNSTFLLFLNGFDHSLYNDRSIVAYVVPTNGTAIAINTAANRIELNRWHHVAVTYDSAASPSVRIFVDGLQVPADTPLEANSMPRLPVLNNLTFPLYLGESSSGARAFNGKIAEVRIWDRVLSASEINTFHAVRRIGNEPGLQIYLPFDDTSAGFTRSRGNSDVRAQISGAMRAPRLSPYRDFISKFQLSSTDSVDGWWDDALLGAIFGDAHPWIYWQPLGWLFAGHSNPTDGYFLHASDALLPGWLFTDSSVFPWIYFADGMQWRWFWQDSSHADFLLPHF